MTIVTVKELQEGLSNIIWNDEQCLFAETVLEGLESGLEGALYNAPISPRAPRREMAAILESGQVATRYPVSSVSAINGTSIVLDKETPFVDPWTLERGRLHYGSSDAPISHGYPWGGGSIPHIRNVGSVELVYRPGWGAIPALKLAILLKARTIMNATQDDSLQVRNTDGTQLPPPPQFDWTDAELLPLGIYRNLTAWR